MPETEGVNERGKHYKRIIFLAVCLILFCSCLTFNLQNGFLPIYNADHNVTTTWTGAIIGAGPLTIIVACFLSAFLLNRFSNRVLFAVPTAVLGLATALNSLLDFMPNSRYYEIVSFIVRLVQGLAGGMVNAAAFAVLVSIYPENAATVVAIADAILNAALAAGPFLGSILYSAGGFKLALIVPGVAILLCTLPGAFIPQLSSRNDVNSLRAPALICDPWILFPAWHCAACTLLLSYHTPILSVYVEEVFGEGIVWVGFALLVPSGAVGLSSIVIGFLIDQYLSPYFFFLSSAVLLPVTYLFIGPSPLLTFLAPSKTQLLIALAGLGLVVPMGCISSLLIMFDMYKVRKGAETVPGWVSNVLLSLYSGSFPVGICIAVISSGIVAEQFSFEQSTGGLALAFLLHTAASIVFYVLVTLEKAKKKEEVAGEIILKNINFAKDEEA